MIYPRVCGKTLDIFDFGLSFACWLQNLILSREREKSLVRMRSCQGKGGGGGGLCRLSEGLVSVLCQCFMLLLPLLSEI